MVTQPIKYLYYFHKKKHYFFRKIQPKDFLDFSENIPFTWMILKKDMSAYQKVKETFGEKGKLTISIEVLRNCMLKTLKVVDIGKSFQRFENDEDLFKEEEIFIINVFFFVVYRSLKFLKTIQGIHMNSIMHIDLMAKRYSISPLNVICKNKKAYNNLDEFLFNRYVAIHMKNQEIEEINKQNRATHGR